MLSNTLEDEDVDFQVRGASISESDNFEKPHSIGIKTKTGKKTIARATFDCNKFMDIFETFENALSQIKIENINERTLEKLIKIEKVLKKKILQINTNNRVKHKNDNLLERFSLSLENLSSKTCKKNVKVELFSAEFLKRINCPFCSVSQADKIKLIEHMDGNCKPRLNKMFDEKRHLPLSVFQILPNNTFKCNICPSIFLPDLMNYFKHLQNIVHISAYNKTAKVKNYTEFLFCACCKVQVANNYTQIHFHMNHQIHKARSKTEVPNSEYFLKKGIHCVYIKDKKFKCLDCSLHYYKSPGDILKHFEDQKHIKNIRKNVPDLSLVFCGVCSKEVHLFEIFNHFKLNEHKDKENEIIKENYELCFFCGFVCGNLMDLSLHMESKCSAINNLRKQNPKLKKKVKKDLREDKTTDESNIDAKYVIVKGYKKIPALYSCFEQFGEITSLKLCCEEHIMIKFKEKSALAKIFLHKNELSIDGIKLEITTDDEMFKYKEGMSVSEEKQILSESENSHSSCNGSESEEDSGSIEDSDFSYNRILRRDQLQTLFQKVTSQLMNISQKLDSIAEVRTILDGLENCIGNTCNLVGLAGCELSFPVERISIYFAMEIDSSDSFPKENISVNERDAATKILSEVRKKMIESELWQNVIISVRSFPHIKCQHKETQKSFTITCAKSARLLTEMLRDCLRENDLIRSFCVLIRFWLTVHKLQIRKFEYVIISFFIFFLISKKVVNLSREKYYNKEDFSLEKKIEDMLDLNQISLKQESKEAFNLQGLFYKFLEFLSTFNFDKLAIYLPLSYPVPKVFVLKKLKAITETSNYDEILKCPMYITESDFLLNLAFCVNEKHVKSLLKIVNSSIKNYRS